MKVQIWDAETLGWRDSAHEYEHTTLTGTRRADYEDKPLVVNLYADMETGIVTADPEKYEAWLASKGLLA